MKSVEKPNSGADLAVKEFWFLDHNSDITIIITDFLLVTLLSTDRTTYHQKIYATVIDTSVNDQHSVSS
jgi:hypothetical protein